MQHKLKEPDIVYEKEISYIKCNKKTALSRLRYDRIALVLVVLILVIVAISLLAAALKSSKDEDVKEVNNIVNSEVNALNLTPKVDNSRAVYLSPSNQWDNEYTGVDTTEAEEMRRVAEVTKTYLIERGLKVYMAGEDATLVEKVELANDLGVGIYVSIHSNAGDALGEGTECFYNSNIKNSHKLASYVYNNVAATTPTDDRGLIDVLDTQLYEIRNTKMASCLVEVEFHDIEEHALWIVDNIDTLGEAIGEGIMQYYQTLDSQN